MRRVRRRREHVSVSLFPFLAVLICTLGVLIVMLVMAVQNADVEARKESESKQEKDRERIEELQAKLDSQQVLIDGLNMVRPEVTSRLAQTRDKRGYLEEEIRKLDREGAQVARQLAELTNQQKSVSSEVFDDNEFDSLESKISEAKTKLATVKQASAEFQTVAYSIVPSESPGGTQRRPIYVECDRRGVVLQPFDIVLTADDFPDPIFPGNPLDAALLVVRQYWKKHDLAGESGNPYPLLVIRPTGAQSYVAARLAMKSWDDEFGYETVEASKTLDFGSVDQVLKEEIEKAIEQARANQRNLIAATVEQSVRRRAVRQASRGKGTGGWVVSGDKGGFKEWNGGQGAEPGLDSSLQRQEQSDRPKPSYDSVLDRYVTGNTNARTSKRNRSRPAPPQPGPPSSAPKDSGGGPMKLGNLSDSRESLADSRGEGWALPSKTPNAVGYLRPLRIHCTESRMGVFNGQSNLAKVIEFGDDAEDAVDQLIDYLWKQIDTWGSAGNNAYWRPELRVKVQPGGEPRFRELQLLLDRSGLEIKEATQ